MIMIKLLNNFRDLCTKENFNFQKINLKNLSKINRFTIKCNSNYTFLHFLKNDFARMICRISHLNVISLTN